MRDAARRMSENGLALIHEFEQGPQGGMASMPYRDWAGVQTIGWGHAIKPGECFVMPLTAEQADALLREDVADFEGAVNRAVAVPLTQSMFDALVCFAFNVGAGNFAMSTLLRLLNQRYYAAAANQFGRWNKSTNPHTGKKEPLRGLTRKRGAEKALFESEGMTP